MNADWATRLSGSRFKTPRQPKMALLRQTTVLKIGQRFNFDVHQRSEFERPLGKRRSDFDEIKSLLEDFLVVGISNVGDQNTWQSSKVCETTQSIDRGKKPTLVQ